jgi:hypothetical protein
MKGKKGSSLVKTKSVETNEWIAMGGKKVERKKRTKINAFKIKKKIGKNRKKVS